jgi:DNA-binding beta-propeller fold protein YncE
VTTRSLLAALSLAAVWFVPAASADVTVGGCIRDDTSSAPCFATSPALDQVLPLAVFDDQLYSGALRDDAVSAFDHDSGGSLGLLGCWQSSGFGADRCGGRTNGLRYTTAVVVSPDGRNLYALGQTGNALVLFDRSPVNGEVTPTGCWTTTPPVRTGEITDCGPNVTPGLERPTGLAISPDGESVYVTAAFSSTIATFSRNTATGALTPGPTVAGRGLLSGVTVTQDGGAVYVTSYQGAISTFERSAAAGHALVARGCLGVASLGCTPQPSTAMDRASFPRVSPDDRTVLVAGRGTTVFARNPATSALTWAGCLDGPGTTDCGPVTGLLGAIGVAISPDGENVYANSGGIVGEPGAMVVFARNTATGILTFTRCIKNPASTLPCGRTAPAIDGNGDVVVTPHGDVVYSAAGTPGASAIVWFTRTRDPRPAGATAPDVSGSSVPAPSTASVDLPVTCRPGATEYCDGDVGVDLLPAPGGRTAAKPSPIGSARVRTRTKRGKATVRVKLNAAGRRALKRGSMKVRVRITRRNPNGTTTKATKTVTLVRKR